MSKMPKANGAKIASALRIRKFWMPVVLFVFIFTVLIALWAGDFNNDIVVSIKNSSFRMEHADTPEKRQQGLSGREKIRENEGMVFSFEQEGRQCFWMKDMKFNLDIVWIDYWEKIVHIEKNVSPSTYPKSFCPELPAKFVLEFKAGTADRLQLKEKDTIFLPCLLRQGCYN